MTDFAAARENMVESQLRPNRVTEPRLIAAMGTIPRERFVPSSRSAAAYCDEDIKLGTPPGADGGERYLMAPMTFGRLVQLAEVSSSDLILDIGCGTGYSAAVLGQIGDAVVALESSGEAAEQASALLSEIGVDNVAVIGNPLAEGYSREGPYDVIILEGGVGHVPPGLLAQLKDGGRLVAVVNDGSVGTARLYRKSGENVSDRDSFDAVAEPLPGFERPEQAFTF